MRGLGGSWQTLVCAALLWAPAGCADLAIIDHDALVDEEPGDNFPQDAIARCGPLPQGVEPIEGLSTAWAVMVAPDKDNNPTFSVATQSLVLRLSDQGIGCDETLAPELLTCPDGWATDITVRQGDPKPGRYALADHGQGFSVATVWRERRGNTAVCEGETVDSPFSGGEVEIFTVTDDCVVGRLVDTALPLGEAGAPVQGGFVALRCDPDA